MHDFEPIKNTEATTELRLQQHNPYGSGMTMTIPSSPNSDWQAYRFTGKELQRQNGLNLYDFGARMFDVAGVPMWTSMDPLAEDYYHLNPYLYCVGDPVNYIDMNGDSIWIEDKNGRYLYNNGTLYNSDGSEFSGKMRGFVKNAYNALNKINDMNSGKDCLNSLSVSEHSFVIKSGGNHFKASEVKYATIMINNPDKDPSIFKKSNHPDKKLGNAYKDELIHAMPFENKLRKEAKIPLRKAYAKDSKGNLFMLIK